MSIIYAGQIAGALIAIATLVGMLIKWLVVKPIKLYIDQATYPIQPSANGGKSLPDLINQVREIRDLIVDHLDDHKDNTLIK